MINTLTDTHGIRLLAAMRQQIEENRRQTFVDGFGLSSARQLKQLAEEAQRYAGIMQTFGNLGGAAMRSGQAAAQSLGERLRELKENNSGFAVAAEIVEACRRVEREEAMREQRESALEMARDIERRQAARFAAPLPLPEVEPLTIKPFKLTMEINVVINAVGKEQSTNQEKENGGENA